MAELTIRKVCVVGAGTMGGGIAAHLANLGFSVCLLDVSQNAAISGLDRARAARPALFYLPEKSNEIRLGNIEEHFHWTEEADWICEAIVERLEAKQMLFARLDRTISPYAMVTTNTSGIEISSIARGLSDSFRKRFMGTHFFNPARYMKLLELVPTLETDPDVVAQMTAFLEDSVGRRVVRAKDTPGFIANRYGMWCVFHAIRVAENLRFAVEDVDMITGPFLGRPKSGTFRLCDVIGLDVMKDIASGLLDRCPEDPRIKNYELTPSMVSLLGRGWLGDKTGHGYYRREGRDLFSLDLNTFAYRMHRESELNALEDLRKLPLGERIQAALLNRNEIGEYLRRYLLPALAYANELKEQVSYSVLDFDRVMKWGFGWEMGPFQMIDAIGPERLGISQPKSFYNKGSQLAFSGRYLKIQDPDKFQPLAHNPEIGEADTYRLRDLGDGVTAVCLTTKLGVITPKVIAELAALLSHKFDNFVLTSEGRSFSAGFDLKFFLERISAGDFADIENALVALQRLGERLENRTCVAAVFGHCLGAGLELALSCPRIVALAETRIGLPETRVGLIPGGRGVTLMRLYNSHSAKRLVEVTGTMTEGAIADNAELARQYGYLRPTDLTVFNPDQLIYRAKAALEDTTAGERPVWTASLGPLVGMIDQHIAQLKSRGQISEHDETIGYKLRQIVARSTGYEDSLERERAEFLDLCSKQSTQARIRHMLETGKPLRN